MPRSTFLMRSKRRMLPSRHAVAGWNLWCHLRKLNAKDFFIFIARHDFPNAGGLARTHA